MMLNLSFCRQKLTGKVLQYLMIVIYIIHEYFRISLLLILVIN